jgi:hypothetical protein
VGFDSGEMPGGEPVWSCLWDLVPGLLNPTDYRHHIFGCARYIQTERDLQRKADGI